MSIALKLTLRLQQTLSKIGKAFFKSAPIIRKRAAKEMHKRKKQPHSFDASLLPKLAFIKAANQLISISRSVEVYRAEMDRLAAMLPEYPVVMAMYGVGKSYGPQLMAEIGDVRRFERKQALVAFAGIDPMPNQSGDKNVRSNKSSKRGSPYLRKTLFNVIRTYLQCAPQDEPVFQFLNRKRAEGKPFYVYMLAAANKFLRRYYAKLRDYFASLDTLQPVAPIPTILKATL